jgi:hypothetical protein
MRTQKFKLGQTVDYWPDKLQADAARGAYKITRLVPAVGRDLQYRIKSASEPFERMARESQLQTALPS